MTEPSQALFLFGPGYSGHALARIWDGPVRGTARTPEKAEALEAAGIEPVAVDDEAALQSALNGAHLVISAPPGDSGCPAAMALGAVAGQAASVTYLSTTGVYGDRAGGWVFEWSRPSPGSERGARRVDAEQAWLGLRPEARLVRLPGIYGPGRSVLDRVRAGKARRILKPGQVFSRIHVEDLASGLKAMIKQNETGVFHLCDDEAAPPQDVTAYGAELLDLPIPEAVAFETAEFSAMARSFYSECKRVSNARAKAALGWQPQYATYREGLTAIAERET